MKPPGEEPWPNNLAPNVVPVLQISGRRTPNGEVADARVSRRDKSGETRPGNSRRPAEKLPLASRVKHGGVVVHVARTKRRAVVGVTTRAQPRLRAVVAVQVVDVTT